MNLSSYLTSIGAQNMDELARTDMWRQHIANQLAMEQEAAQGQAIGGLVSAGLGAAAGLYAKYNKAENSADALRGFQARKDFANVTDSAVPVDTRIANEGQRLYGDGPGTSALVNERVAAPSQLSEPAITRPAGMNSGTLGGPMSEAYKSGIARSNNWRDEAAAATGTLPRLSYRHQLVNDNPDLPAGGGAAAVPGGMRVHGMEAKYVPNDPVADYEKLLSDDVKKLFLSDGSTYDRALDFSNSRIRRY